MNLTIYRDSCICYFRSFKFKDSLTNLYIALSNLLNIVKVLWENYGYRVLDLGRDVAPEKILAAVQESGAKLVGMTALMTTTVPAMEETIALLRQQQVPVRILVGGAVMTAEYAARIGADGYAGDAVAAVDFANALFGRA